jgi:hypothetical protein
MMYLTLAWCFLTFTALLVAGLGYLWLLEKKSRSR